MKKSPSTSTGAKAQSNTDSFSGWSNDWNDVLESPKGELNLKIKFY